MQSFPRRRFDAARNRKTFLKILRWPHGSFDERAGLFQPQQAKLIAVLLAALLLASCSPLTHGAAGGESTESSQAEEAIDRQAELEVGSGVEASLKESLRGMLRNYREAQKNAELPDAEFVVCSTDYDQEQKVKVTSCSKIVP